MSIVFVCLLTITSNILGAFVSKSKKCYNPKPLAYCFCVKTKISVHLRVCISVPVIQILYSISVVVNVGQLTLLSNFSLVMMRERISNIICLKNRKS